jgi:hypothetical protein
MPRGKIKLGLNILMARGTEIRLRTSQELLGDRGSVNLMAIIARDGSQFVNAPVELEEFLLPLVAAQTAIGAIFRGLIFKREDKTLALCLCMFLSRAVARFASFFLGRHLGVDDAAPVGSVSFKSFVNVRVALLANFGSDISTRLGLFFLLAKGCKSEEGYQNGQGTEQRQNPSWIHK